MNVPKVSVVVPAYNAGKYVREALDSVLRQTYRNYEVIVIDDGSTDNTSAVLAEFPQICCLHTDRIGAAAARNLGIKNSKGEFIAFLDADDIWHPQKLEKQVALMADDPLIGFTFTESGFFNDSGVFIEKIGKKKRLMNGDIVKNIFWKSGIGTPTVMVRRAVFDTVGYFEEDLICSEDDNMWMRIALYTNVKLIDEQLVLVRVHGDSLSQKKGNIFKGVKSHLELLEQKYPQLINRLGVLINKKHAILHMEMGLEYLANKRKRAARQEFRKSIGFDPGSVMNYGYWLATYLPDRLLAAIKSVKGLFKSNYRWLKT